MSLGREKFAAPRFLLPGGGRMPDEVQVVFRLPRQIRPGIPSLKISTDRTFSETGVVDRVCSRGFFLQLARATTNIKARHPYRFAPSPSCRMTKHQTTTPQKAKLTILSSGCGLASCLRKAIHSYPNQSPSEAHSSLSNSCLIYGTSKRTRKYPHSIKNQN